MKMRTITMALISSGLLGASLAHATPVNITINDNHSASGYIGTGIGKEDNETEPGTIQTDAWDYEALGYDSSTKRLDVIGTFNFAQGQVSNGKTYHSGAIFIGTGATLPGANAWNYAYVLDFNNNTYALYNSFNIVLPTDIPASSPWTITPTAGAIATGSFLYATGLSNPDGFGLTTMGGGGNAPIHNMISLSLTDLSPTVLNDFWVHTTPECGNDNLNGHYKSVPDAGATMLLLSAGLGALACMKRRFV